MAMVKSPNYRFSYSKGNGGLSAQKLLREDKIHLANKIVVDGSDSKKVSSEYCLRPDTLREWVRKLKNGAIAIKEGPLHCRRKGRRSWWNSVHQEYTT